MRVHIHELIAGAREAQGLTVIIDVFRAFSLECYMFRQGAACVHPVGSLEEAFRLKEAHPDWILFGERGGARVEGCEYGNSPSSIENTDLCGRTVIHTTSAGTQGIVNAGGASGILTGSLVNAGAVAEYICKVQPEEVSLVAMGKAGLATAEEDVLCAEYLRSLILGEPLRPNPCYEGTDIETAVRGLRKKGGDHFFDPARQHIYPERDFRLCTRLDQFPLVLRVVHKDGLYESVPVKTE